MVSLDSLGKEVSGLGGILGDDKGLPDLGNNVLARVEALAVKSKGAHHGKTAVLKLLKLLLLEFFGAVVEAEGIPAGLANTEITGDAVKSFLLDEGESSELNPGHGGDNLGNSKVRNVVELLKGVDVGVGVGTSPFVTRESSDPSGDDEAQNGELGNTSVGDLSFTEPLHGIDVAGVKAEGFCGKDVPWLGGETNGVQTGISNKGTIEGVRGELSGEGIGNSVPTNIKSSGGLTLLGRGEGGGGSSKEGGNSELHGVLDELSEKKNIQRECFRF